MAAGKRQRQAFPWSCKRDARSGKSTPPRRSRRLLEQRRSPNVIANLREFIPYDVPTLGNEEPVNNHNNQNNVNHAQVNGAHDEDEQGSVNEVGLNYAFEDIAQEVPENENRINVVIRSNRDSLDIAEFYFGAWAVLRSGLGEDFVLHRELVNNPNRVLVITLSRPDQGSHVIRVLT
ncbi:hypothetical protein BJV82DRAFT_672369 [Fennellomyces sp. T-0311]|nr:hypothetical protein BJV82DRAFT_672369 [Fennellomyces sp. T-0311]